MMKAAVLTKEKNERGEYKVEVTQRERKKPGEGEVEIQIMAASLNHRDVWMTQGMYPGLRFGSILGADGAGLVVSAPPSLSHWIGEKVLIDSSYHWGPDIQRPGPDFRILGSLPLPGTFAQFIVCPIEQVHRLPPHLDYQQGAALPLAGLTAYRATFTKGEVSKGKKVLITGIGGGVALFSLQMAVAVGATVYVTSSSQSKIQAAIKMGAAGGVLYNEEGWEKKLGEMCQGKLDVVVDGAGGEGVGRYLKLMSNGGIISIYGATAGGPGDLLLPHLFLKNVEIRGTAMGSPAEFASFLLFLQSHSLLPVLHSVFPFDRVADALDLMRAGGQFGKIVLSFPSDPHRL